MNNHSWSSLTDGMVVHRFGWKAVLGDFDMKKSRSESCEKWLTKPSLLERFEQPFIHHNHSSTALDNGWLFKWSKRGCLTNHGIVDQPSLSPVVNP